MRNQLASSFKNFDATVIGCPTRRFLYVMISRSIALVIATYINLLSSPRVQRLLN